MQQARGLTLAVFLCLAAAVAATAADRPVTVSPGGLAVVEVAPNHCPTFSWGGVDEARSYEIVGYTLTAAERTAESIAGRNPALGVTVPGAASSWTPAADRCLAGGVSFVWFVRALHTDGTVGEWSEGSMFRTPALAPRAALREEIWRVVQLYMAAPKETLQSSPHEISAAAAETVPPAPSADSPLGGRATARAPDPLGTPAFKAEDPTTSGTTTYGVYGVSNSSDDGSVGVAGYTSATTGEVAGTAGFNDSVQGFGVYGLNSATSGGVGVMARDEAASGITAGVVGLTQNTAGYGGFFWHEDGGDALVVADPELHPASVDVKLFVDVDGNLGLVGVIKFTPTDTPTEGCIGATEGSVYYDDSLNTLCVCDGSSYKRVDTGAAC